MNVEGIVKAVTQPKEFNGELQIGFLIDGVWYNVLGTKEELDVVLQFVKKGNTIGFDCSDDKKVSNIHVIEEAKESEADDMVNFEALLTCAHEKKEDFSIETQMLAIDLEKKYALFKARVLVGGVKVGDVDVPGRVFEAHGDATDENIKGDFIKPHFIRMAETRAIVRALRWYTNSAVAEEEKGDKPSSHNHKEVKHG